MPTLPTITPSGSCPQEILEEYSDTLGILSDAAFALSRTRPLEKDYPANVYRIAVAEFNARIAALDAIMRDVQAIANHCSDNALAAR